MPDLIIKPQATSGNKVIIQDQGGGAVLTTADSGGVVASTVTGGAGIIPNAVSTLVLEEGAWTPTGTNVDTDTAESVGTYTRIGKCVICYYYYHTNGTAGSDLGGLPFTSRATLSNQGDNSTVGAGSNAIQNKTASQPWVNYVLKNSQTWRHSLGAGGSVSLGNAQNAQGMLIYFID